MKIERKIKMKVMMMLKVMINIESIDELEGDDED
jgi:hypothetical protein